MAPLTLTEHARELLDDIPPQLREDPDVRAVLYCYAKEAALLDAAAEHVRDQFFPSTADALLPAWEAILGLAINPVGRTVAQRRDDVTAAVLRSVTSGSGRSWEADMLTLAGAGVSYQEFDRQDTGNPVAAHTIRVTVPYPPGSDTFLLVARLLREITPANTAIQLQSTAGFRLDASQLDQQAFGGN